MLIRRTIALIGATFAFAAAVALPLTVNLLSPDVLPFLFSPGVLSNTFLFSFALLGVALSCIAYWMTLDENDKPVKDVGVYGYFDFVTRFLKLPAKRRATGVMVVSILLGLCVDTVYAAVQHLPTNFSYLLKWVAPIVSEQQAPVLVLEALVVFSALALCALAVYHWGWRVDSEVNAESTSGDVQRERAVSNAGSTYSNIELQERPTEDELGLMQALYSELESEDEAGRSSHAAPPPVLNVQGGEETRSDSPQEQGTIVGHGN